MSEVSLDMRDKAIVDALPVCGTMREILVVGCGEGRLDRGLVRLGYSVLSTDIVRRDLPNFNHLDINDVSPFPIKTYETVICSQVLEHLDDWIGAFRNCLNLATRRLIVTVPVRECFCGEGPDGHVVFWDDREKTPHRDINEFKDLATPYSTAISKIKTKREDRAGGTEWSGGGSEGVDDLMRLLIQLRTAAKSNRDYATADAIRDKLQAIGFTLEDRPGGTEWK